MLDFEIKFCAVSFNIHKENREVTGILPIFFLKIFGRHCLECTVI